MPEVNAAAHLPSAEPFDMKAGQFTIPTLVLRGTDVDALDAFLARQVARLPAFFDQAPVAIDLSTMPDGAQFDDLPMVVGMLRGHGMVPVGVRGATDAQKAQALALELAVMPAGRKVEPAAPARADSAAARPMIVERPVRSGQRIYARNSDLILLGGVGSGAEVMADGHIHAYGPVRGRAMAGVTGDTGARIFCQSLGAELVSIAGLYRVSEHLESQYLGRAVQIVLAGDALRFSLL